MASQRNREERYKEKEIGEKRRENKEELSEK
jgi:hypothetical protein